MPVSWKKEFPLFLPSAEQAGESISILSQLRRENAPSLGWAEATLCPFCPPWWAWLLVTVTFLLRDSQEKAITSHSWRQPSARTDVGSCLTGFCPWGQTGSGLSPKWAGSLPEGLRAALPVPGLEGEQLTSVQLSSGCPAGRASRTGRRGQSTNWRHLPRVYRELGALGSRPWSNKPRGHNAETAFPPSADLTALCSSHPAQSQHCALLWLNPQPVAAWASLVVRW